MSLPIRTVEFEKNGETYSGNYTVQDELLTVTYRMKEKSSLLSGDPPEALAKLLLSELVEENK